MAADPPDLLQGFLVQADNDIPAWNHAEGVGLGGTGTQSYSFRLPQINWGGPASCRCQEELEFRTKGQPLIQPWTTRPLLCSTETLHQRSGQSLWRLASHLCVLCTCHHSCILSDWHSSYHSSSLKWSTGKSTPGQGGLKCGQVGEGL
jgi:hypothetical protein